MATTVSTSPLVWVRDGKYQHPAHLLETKEDTSLVRFITCGRQKWVLKHQVQQLAPRQRRPPRKFADSNEEEMTIQEKGDEPMTVSDASDAGDSPSKDDAPNANDKKLEKQDTPKSPTDSTLLHDEDTSSLTSSSLSSLTQDSASLSTDDTVTNDASSTTNDDVARHNETMPQMNRNVTRTSAFSLCGILGRGDASKTTPAFSAAFALERAGSAVKSLFGRRSGTPSSTAALVHTIARKRSLEESLGDLDMHGNKRLLREMKRDDVLPCPPKKLRLETSSIRPESNDSPTASSLAVSPESLPHLVQRKVQTKSTTPSVVSTDTSKKTMWMEEVIRRIAVEPYAKVQEAVESRVTSGKTLNTIVALHHGESEQTTTTSPILTWATHRCRHFEEKDADKTLQLLLHNGANPYLAANNGQTPLHAAAAGGVEVAVQALLNHVEYSVDLLNTWNEKGETPLHAAISNGNLNCFQLLVNKFSAQVVLEQVHDRQGENVLTALVRCSDINYDQKHASFRQSKNLAIMQQLLQTVKQERLVKPLIHRNKAGMSVMVVAAMCGCYHEVKELSKIEFDCGRSIANQCITVDNEIKSPLDLALGTVEMMKQNATAQEYKDLGIDGIGNCCNNRARLKNWKMNGLLPTIELLKDLQEPLTLQTLRQTSRYREGGRKLSSTQLLTKMAQKLQLKYAPNAAKNVRPPTIECDLKLVKCINNPRSNLYAQLVKMVRTPRTIPQVTTAQIRDPKDPCLRNSTSITTKHYGVFANDFIPKHTVICEYAGLVRREDEGTYDPNPEYAVKLNLCDEWACMEGGNYANAYILDAAGVINEGSLINDVRDCILEDESEPEVLRTENCMFVEVLINKWPRVFVITLQDIQAGEELLLDYGAAYWEKLSLKLMKDKLDMTNERNQELETEIFRLRQELKKHHQ